MTTCSVTLEMAGCRTFAEAYHPMINGMVIVGVFWLILFWMYRRKIFLRV